MDYEILEELERIVKVTYSLSNLYQKLCKLEIKGMKNSEEYQKNLNYLKLVLEIEKDYYSKDKLDTKKMYIMSDYLKYLTGIDEYNMEILADEKKQEPSIIARVQNNLFLVCTNDYNNLSDFLPEEVLKQIEDNNRKNSDEFISFDTFSIIESHVEKDLKMAFLYFLEKFINNSNFSRVKSRLIAIKYKFIFINKDIENLALQTEFNTDNIFKSDYDTLAKKLEVNKDTIIEIKNKYTETYYSYHVKKLLEIDDVNYNMIQNLILSILNQCFIRASLMTMSDDLIDSLNYSFHDYEQKSEYLNKYPNSSISQNLVIECFRKIKKAKKHIKVLKPNM